MNCDMGALFLIITGTSAFWLFWAWVDRRNSDRKIAALQQRVDFLEAR
jgi:hypothetical protein